MYSPNDLCKVLDALSRSLRPAQAVKVIGASESSYWLWLKRSTENPTDARLLVRWPDPDGEAVSFAAAAQTARRLSIARLEAALREEIELGANEVQVGPNGVQWEVDPVAVAQWSDADTAYCLGGIVDWPYAHDPVTGGRIPLIVRRSVPAALRIHGARSVLGSAGWNPSDRRETDTRISGRILITGATRQGTPAPYARPATPVMNELQRDLLSRLEDLRQRGPVNSRPTHPVRVEGRPAPNDPPERTVEQRAPSRAINVNRSP